MMTRSRAVVWACAGVMAGAAAGCGDDEPARDVDAVGDADADVDAAADATPDADDADDADEPADDADEPGGMESRRPRRNKRSSG